MFMLLDSVCCWCALPSSTHCHSALPFYGKKDGGTPRQRAIWNVHPSPSVPTMFRPVCSLPFCDHTQAGFEPAPAAC